MKIEAAHPQISVSRQCELLGLARSSFYYEPQRNDSYNELLMRLIDEQYTQAPFYGVRRMTAWLRNTGHPVNHKRVARLMDLMGLEAIYPKPKTSKGHPQHKKYPYLLEGLEIVHPNQVWATDIKEGFYLPHGHHGLVQPICSVLGDFDYSGDGILPCSS